MSYVTTHHLGPDLTKGNCARNNSSAVLGYGKLRASDHAFEAGAILDEKHVIRTRSLMLMQDAYSVLPLSETHEAFMCYQLINHPAQSHAAFFLKGYATMALTDSVNA